MNKSVINYRAISKVMGWMLLIEAALFVPPLVVSVIYGEKDYWAFLVSLGCCLVSGLAFALPLKGRLPGVKRRESYLLTGLDWVLFSVFGMLPFIMSPTCSLSVTDAFFEAMSGFTTTGATVITDVDQCSKGILFWRSEMQWFGGLGIILFTLALLPDLNRSEGLHMFNTEATGITHDKIHPRIGYTAKTLWRLYVWLTVSCVIMLWMGPMNLFDSMCTAMSCLSTGGFSTHTQGLAYWDSGYVNGVLTVFMFIGGVNFILLYKLLQGEGEKLWKNDVFHCYCEILAAAFFIVIVSMLINGEGAGMKGLVIDPLCQLVSAFTSTGFASMHYETMGATVLAVIMTLMAIGACAGSTTGGLKVDRFLVLFKNMINESQHTLFPNCVKCVSVNSSSMTYGMMGRIFGFVMWYVVLVGAVTIITTMCGFPLTDSLFGSLSCISNNGLGYGVSGSAGSFGAFPGVVKWLMSFLMLAGRLELFTILVLFMPRFWKN